MNPSEFWYERATNTFYSVTPEIVNNEDGYLYQKRSIEYDWESDIFYVKNDHTFKPLSVGWGGSKELNMYSTYFPLFKEFNAFEPLTCEHLGVVITTNNPYNEDWIGVSSLDTVIEDIKSLEITMHEYDKLMLLTKPRAFILNEAVEYDVDGNPTLDMNNDVYVGIDGNAVDNPSDLVQISQYNFYAEKFETKIQGKMRYILSKLILDVSVTAFDNNKIERSATEIASSDSSMIASIENKRSEYKPQMISIIHLVNLDITDTINISFIPIQLSNWTSVVNNVTMLKGIQLISDETALRMLNPRYTDEQIKQELDRISKDNKTRQEMYSNGSSPPDSTGGNNYTHKRRRYGYN
jgi:hypothetical protein